MKNKIMLNLMGLIGIIFGIIFFPLMIFIAPPLIVLILMVVGEIPMPPDIIDYEKIISYTKKLKYNFNNKLLQTVMPKIVYGIFFVFIVIYFLSYLIVVTVFYTFFLLIVAAVTLIKELSKLILKLVNRLLSSR